MGAAGDMLAGALVGLFDDKQKIIEELNSIGIPDTEIVYSEKNVNSLNASYIEMIIDGEKEEQGEHHSHSHSHRHLSDVFGIIDSLNTTDKVKSDVKEIYEIVSAAEAKAHGREVGEVHFHELGMLDAIADITSCAYLINKLSPEKITASPINVGNGNVKCAHGILPVPAPATANILIGVPYYKSDIMSELCTPTGAAVLKYYAEEFIENPKFEKVIKIGLGAGTKELPRANVVRALSYEGEGVTELSCNIDDMTGEEAAFASEIMMNKGALDCFISPIIMKKGRPAYLFTVLCKADEAERFAKLIFRHTTTIGIRKYTPSRYTLKREFIEDSGVTLKRSEGYGVAKGKYEFEDIKKLALENDISVFEARKILEE